MVIHFIVITLENGVTLRKVNSTKGKTQKSRQVYTGTRSQI